MYEKRREECHFEGFVSLAMETNELLLDLTGSRKGREKENGPVKERREGEEGENGCVRE
jgi:hypothetical protein